MFLWVSLKNNTFTTVVRSLHSARLSTHSWFPCSCSIATAGGNSRSDEYYQALLKVCVKEKGENKYLKHEVQKRRKVGILILASCMFG